MTIKKISALLLLSVLPLGVLTAQEEKDYLPKAGDWAIGIDMEPVYKYFGNLFYTGEGAEDRNYLDEFGGKADFDFMNAIQHTIMGKYMLSDELAIRANIGFGKNVSNRFDYVPDDYALYLNPFSEAEVTDYLKRKTAATSFAIGAEYRKGKDRIQGIFGADLLYASQKAFEEYSYGNATTEINQVPRGFLTGEGWIGYNPGNANYLTGERITETFAKDIIFGITGRIGVEYFVVPKLSFGGEVSLSLYERWELQQYEKSEGWNAIAGELQEHTQLLEPGDRYFHAGTDNLGGKLFMMFYF